MEIDNFWPSRSTDELMMPVIFPGCSDSVGVAGIGVSEGGTGVSEGGIEVSVGGIEVSVGGMEVSVGGFWVLVGGIGLLEGVGDFFAVCVGCFV